MRKKTKIEKGLLALLVAPDIIFMCLLIASGLIYFFLK